VRRFSGSWLCWLALALACASPARWQEPLAEAASIDAAAWAADAAWLADPAREGRGLGTAGLDAAARFLAERFAEAGLEGGAAGGGFLQTFRMPVAIAVAEQRLTAGGRVLAPGRDFRALLASESGHFAGELVFAGHGIHDPATGWDDYARLDAEGAVLAVLDGRPSGPAFAERRGAALAERAAKLATARRRGARAVLFLPKGEDDGFSRPGGALPTAASAGVIALALSRRGAERLAALSGHALAEWVRRAETGEPLPLRVRVAGAVGVARREGEVANVIGRLPGGDPERAHEVVVVGAHYDHLGRGEFGSLSPAAGSEVHPGADDNASGAAGLVALARALAAGPRPARTLAFVAFTAEEAGLIGSARYVQALGAGQVVAASEARSEAKPSEVVGPEARSEAKPGEVVGPEARSEAKPGEVVSMLNLDMIGRLGEAGVSAYGAETAPAFADLVRRLAARRGLAVSFVDGSHGPSDHASFHAAKIPALFFTTGVHEAYHTPADRAEVLRAEGAARVLGLAADVTLALADVREAPRFAAVAPPPRPTAPHAGGGGPWLGTVPAFGAAGPPGARIAAVIPGSPAERAGLSAGDVIVSFAGASVASLEELAALLRAQSEGSEVAIEVQRGAERIELRAVLGRRP
jgi:Zn-dependent M28 family amino/carboxypeptidase